MIKSVAVKLEDLESILKILEKNKPIKTNNTQYREPNIVKYEKTFEYIKQTIKPYISEVR